jgi:DNA-binding beta-propeller fold protein YncE
MPFSLDFCCPRRIAARPLIIAVLAVGSAIGSAQSPAHRTSSRVERVPAFRVDPKWPKPLPHHWTMGPVCGVAVDTHGNIWIVQRPVDLAPNARVTSSLPAKAKPAFHPAPQVLEFAADGSLLSSWGGPGPGYDWPSEVHGIYVDRRDSVWIGGAGNKDDQILKFTRKGKFELQIGHPGQSRGSNDTENLGGPANMVIDEAANELYVADGYVNHRVIVFDATTGAYKRHWGAYGRRPDDRYYTERGIEPGEHPNNDGRSSQVPAGPPPPQFDLVHAVRIAKDGLVYVCDRSHNRIQVFTKNGAFVQEAFIANDLLASGSVSDIGFSKDAQQRFAFVLDSTKQHVYVLDRKSLKILSTFGEQGSLPGQFGIAHNLAVDAHGNLFITESKGQRIQKFVAVGTRDVDSK